ncbi:30S ribosomal protein S16 [Patescibacteria group bacterium]
MLRIRMTRVGRKHDPTFRVVVVDSKKATRSGAYLEKLGFCNPRKNNFQLNAERIKYWISKGAQTSDTVHNLLVSEKIVEGGKLNVSAKSKKKEESKEDVDRG